MIQLTGVASRYVGFVVALMLIVLGLFPAVSGLYNTFQNRFWAAQRL